MQGEGWCGARIKEIGTLEMLSDGWLTIISRTPSKILGVHSEAGLAHFAGTPIQKITMQQLDLIWTPFKRLPRVGLG